jgi:hypothetical protein
VIWSSSPRPWQPLLPFRLEFGRRDDRLGVDEALAALTLHRPQGRALEHVAMMAS